MTGAQQPTPLQTASPETDRALLRLKRGLIPAPLVDEAVATLCDLIDARLGEAGGGDLDARVDRLRVKDRKGLSAVYDAFRETVIFQRVITAPSLLAAAARMIGAHRLQAPFQHAVFRLDLAGEHWRGFGWHQDYAYNMLSDGYVTAWTPLTPTDASNGAIDVAPGVSDRLYPVDIRFKRDADGRRRGTRDAFIAERLQATFERHAEKLALLPGDVALFTSRLVHRSGFNPGPRHRYSIQVRFGDLLAPDVVARDWRNRRSDGFDTFKALQPHLVDYEEV